MNSIIGHEVIISRLLQSIEKGKLHHSSLFVGPSGVGKKKVAQFLAQTLLCESDSQACGTCPSCVQLSKGQHPALKLIEPSGSQIKIDGIRDVLKFLSLQSWHPARVVIFDSAHLLNSQASNALLKAVEEPPANVYFIFLAPSAKQMISTIRSRSQVFQFGALSQSQLQKVTGISGWALGSAQGSVERVIELTGEDTDKTRQQAVQSFLQIFTEKSARDIQHDLAGAIKDKTQFQFLLRLWQQFTRDLLVGEERFQIHHDFAGQWDQVPKLHPVINWEIFHLFQRMWKDIESNGDRQLIFESGIIKMRDLIDSSRGAI